MKSISVTQARKDLGDIFGEVNYTKERIILTNRKRRVAIVPFEDLEKLQALEDAEDIAEAETALREYRKNGKAISQQEMKRLLGHA